MGMMERRRVVLITDDTRVNYKEIDTLSKFLTPVGKMLPRRRIGSDAKTQHKIRTAIHRARFMAFLPYGA